MKKKSPYLQFHTLYDNTWVITTDFCSINLVKVEASETLRDIIFIYDPFYEALYRENSIEIKYLLAFVQDCCDLMIQPFVKVNFVVFDVPQAPTNALTGYYAIIFAYCNLQGVSFQNLVLPHGGIGKSLYKFLKDGYFPEALLSNTNPNIWTRIYYGCKKYCIATVTNLVLAT